MQVRGPHGLSRARPAAGPTTPRLARTRAGWAPHDALPEPAARGRGGSMSRLLERPVAPGSFTHWSSRPCLGGADRVATPSQPVGLLLRARRVRRARVTGCVSGRRSVTIGNERRLETNWLTFARHVPVPPPRNTAGEADKEVCRRATSWGGCPRRRAGAPGSPDVRGATAGSTTENGGGESTRERARMRAEPGTRGGTPWGP